MPEGPTLVAIKKQLKHFEGKIVTDSGGYNNDYGVQISGQKLNRITTFGKYLLLYFDDCIITVHFGLFGSFLINDRKKVNASFFLVFQEDFINFYIVKLKQLPPDFDFDWKLDPFSPAYDWKATKKLLLEKFSEKQVGDILLEQAVFPGLGNIIRNEVLFLSKIHPESIVSKIPAKKLKELLLTIQEFSVASVELIEQKIWKSTASVYKKQQCNGQPVSEVVSAKIKRKTYIVEGLQKVYQ